jgi:LacI family transcriptional regulator
VRNSKPTIREVAAAAGVSIGTVSKIVNSTQPFSKEVEKRVREAIAQLGYHSNPFAQSMATGRTNAVGVAVLDIANPHFSSMVKGANRIAMQHGYSLLFVDTDERQSKEKDLLVALSHRVDGFIISSRLPNDQLSAIIDGHKPMVFAGRMAPLRAPCIAVNGYGAAVMLGQLLGRQGHRRVLYLGFPAAAPDKERYRGLSEGLAPFGATVSRFDLEAPSAPQGTKASANTLLGSERYDAVVCFNDLVALGYMHGAQALGLRVPEDISVVGFDNIQYAAFASPPLTTVNMQSERLGEEAMRLLISRINNPDAPYENIVLQPELVLRDSTLNRVVRLETA